MTLCAARRFAGERGRLNVKPRTPRNAPFPPTRAGDGVPFVAPTSKWASVLLTVVMTLSLFLPLSRTLSRMRPLPLLRMRTLPLSLVLGSPAFWPAFGDPASPHRRGRSWLD